MRKSIEKGGERLSGPRVCSQCGKRLDFFDLQEDFTIHKKIGYGSIHDGEEEDLHLCCDCFDRLLASCKVSPVIKECSYGI